MRLRVSLRGDKDYSVNLETKNNDGGSSDVMKTGRVCVCVCVCVAGTVLLIYPGRSSVSYFIYFACRLRRLQIERKKKTQVTQAHKLDIAVVGDVAKTEISD